MSEDNLRPHVYVNWGSVVDELSSRGIEFEDLTVAQVIEEYENLQKETANEK